MKLSDCKRKTNDLILYNHHRCRDDFQVNAYILNPINTTMNSIHLINHNLQLIKNPYMAYILTRQHSFSFKTASTSRI